MTATCTTRLPPFTVTPRAVEAIGALGGAVRVDLEDGGCCGTTYTFALEDGTSDAGPGDERYGCPGAWLTVSADATPVLAGASLDYGATLRPPRFRVVRNPNLHHVCPCRRSFGAPWPGPRQPSCRSYEPMPWDPGFEPPRDWARRTGWVRTEPDEGPPPGPPGR